MEASEKAEEREKIQISVKLRDGSTQVVLFPFNVSWFVTFRFLFTQVTCKSVPKVLVGRCTSNLIIPLFVYNYLIPLF